MKKAYLFFLALLFAVLVNAQSTTPNLGLQLPALGSLNWNVPLNFNFNKLDSLLGGTDFTLSSNVAWQYKPVFNNGIPSNTLCIVNGMMAYNYATVPYTPYVCNGVAGYGTTGIWQLFGSAGGGVTSITPGANVNCTPLVSGNCSGLVTISATGGGSGPIPSNAKFVFTGTSMSFDDSHVLSTPIAVSAWSTSSGVTTFTNTGTNNLHAGDWVNLIYLTGWTWPSQYNGTGGFIFQVLSTGLTSTQFEVNTATNTSAPATCSSSCGNAYSAMSYMPFVATKYLGMPSGAINSTYAFCAPSGCFLQYSASQYSTFLHPLSPAVTGTPAYLIINSPINEISTCVAAATIEGYYQSIMSQAHADGYLVAVMSPTERIYNVSGGACPTADTIHQTVDYWLRSQGKQTVLGASPTSTQYWDIFSDTGSIIWDGNDSNYVANNGGYGPIGALMAGDLLGADLVSGNGASAKPHAPLWTGNLISGLYSNSQYLFVPDNDNQSYQFWNSTRSTLAMQIGWSSAGGTLALLGGSAEFSINRSAGCSVGAAFCIAYNTSNTVFTIDSYGNIKQYDVAGIHPSFYSEAASVKFYGIKPSVTNCLQIDNTGAVTPSGNPCPSGSGTATHGVVLPLSPNGVAASPSGLYQTAPYTFTIAACSFTTTTSDGATALVINVKANGTSILSGASATISAGTAAGTVTSLTLSGTPSITAGQNFELDVTSGTSSWTGAVSCHS